LKANNKVLSNPLAEVLPKLTRLRMVWLVKCFALPRIILLKVKTKQTHPLGI
jgi:hypothetical protein